MSYFVLTKSNVVFKLTKKITVFSFFYLFFLVRSFVEFVPIVLKKYGVDFFLSDKLNQDPIEEHFGCIRGAGESSDNPNLEQYGYRNRKIIVKKSGLI